MVEVLKGNLAQLPLLDIINMLTAGNKSGRLDIHQGSKSGEIYLQQGKLVHAVTGAHMGEKSIFVLTRWIEGDFSFTPDVEAPEQSIDNTTEQILLEASRQAEQWEDIRGVISSTDTVFNLSASGSANTVSLKPIEWQILAQVNGERSIIELAELMDLNEFEVAKIVYSLTTAGLLHEVGDAKTIFREIVDESFFEKLDLNFTEIMGPIAPMIVDDEIKMLGEEKKSFPRDKVSELVERLSLEISEVEKRAEFQKNMVLVLKEL